MRTDAEAVTRRTLGRRRPPSQTRPSPGSPPPSEGGATGSARPGAPAKFLGHPEPEVSRESADALRPKTTRWSDPGRAGSGATPRSCDYSRTPSPGVPSDHPTPAGW
eukprot:8124240-Pyramimonas_sp.AAC.1